MSLAHGQKLVVVVVAMAGRGGAPSRLVVQFQDELFDRTPRKFLELCADLRTQVDLCDAIEHSSESK